MLTRMSVIAPSGQAQRWQVATRSHGCMSVMLPVVALSAISALFAHGSEPQLLTATRLGSPGVDWIEDVTFAPDGTLYVVGTCGEASEHATKRSGTDAPNSAYGHGFVARLSADGRRILAWHEFAKGLTQPTSVAVGKHGVYVGCYGSPPSAGLLGSGMPLLGPPDPWPVAARHAPFDHRHDAVPRRLRNQAGVPLILRLDEELMAINAGTFLEGWQSVWLVPRPLDEDRWQPVEIAVLADGDIVVAHDGGHTSGPDPKKAAHFYHVGDHVSRLSPDLKKRRWKRDIYTPRVDKKRAVRALNQAWRSTRAWEELTKWPHESVGNTRILRLIAGPNDTLIVSGWSASKTVGEPWWCPFCWQLDPSTGKTVATFWSPDPTDGDGRLNTQVSDSLVRGTAFDEKGNLLACLNADGGNSITRRHSRDWRKPIAKSKLRGSVWGFRGRTLFWGLVTRVDVKTGDCLGGHQIAGFEKAVLQAAWPLDLSPAHDEAVVVLGRNTRGFPRSKNATWGGDGIGSFVHIYSEAFDRSYGTCVPGTALHRLARRGDRYAAVGRTTTPRRTWKRDASGRRRLIAPEPVAVMQHESLEREPPGGEDGYLLMFELLNPAR